MNDTYEKEINLMELLFYCLKHWRPILAVMLVAGVLAGAYKYRATVLANQTALDNQVLLESDEEDEEEEETEGEIENPKVTYYRALIDAYESKLEAESAYMQDSLLMQLNPNALPTATLTYYLSVSGDTASAAAALDVLSDAYQSFVTGGQLARELKDIYGDQVTLAEIQYLVSCQDSENYGTRSSVGTGSTSVSNIDVITAGDDASQAILTIQLTAGDSAVCEALLAKTEEVIGAYGSELQKEGLAAHTMTLLSAVQSERIDTSIASYQSSEQSNYASILKSLTSLQDELDKVIEDEGEIITTTSEAVLASPARSAVKYTILGLVLGACLAAFVLVLIYLLGGRMQSTGDFEREFGMPLLGEVTRDSRKKRVFGFIDRWIERLEQGAYADITGEEQMKIAAANLRAAASREKVQRIMLTGTISKEETEAFRAQLAAEAADLSFSDYQRIVFQASALEEVERCDGVLFLEKKGVSYTKLIQQEKALVSGREICVLGTVIL